MTPRIPKASTPLRGRAPFVKRCRTRAGSFAIARRFVRAAGTRCSSRMAGCGVCVTPGALIQVRPQPSSRKSCGRRAGLTHLAPPDRVRINIAWRGLATWRCRGFAGLLTCSASTPRAQLLGGPAYEAALHEHLDRAEPAEDPHHAPELFTQRTLWTEWDDRICNGSLSLPVRLPGSVGAEFNRDELWSSASRADGARADLSVVGHAARFELRQ